MIQRKQSIFLFLAALLNAGVFGFGLYKYHTLVTGADTLAYLRVNDHFPSLLLGVVITLLPLVTIFLFGNRKLQIRLCAVTIASIIAFVAMMLWRVSSLAQSMPPPTGGSYWVGAVLPVISVVLLFMAIGGIRKDEKLVKSVDRLR